MSALESTPLLNNSSSGQSDSPTLESPVLNGQKEQGGTHLFWLVMVIWSGVIVTSMDITIIPTLVTPIGSYFDASHQASYIGTSYLLSVCCFAPLYGRLADVLGRKGALLLALGLSGVGTMLCGLSPSMTTLIAARVVSGMGGGGIMPAWLSRT
ncbi:MFS general substrate transporter [Clavulina sp. PMI_390]|nr:MFS general substrate transporter [Clavulina sp. PMI_390]